MNRIAVALVVASVALVAAAGCSAAPVSPKPAPPAFEVRVDPRLELFAILNRLGGGEEYRQAGGRYIDDLDKHFARFADHPAVVATKKLREEFGISFNAPISLAVHLDDNYRPRQSLAPIPKELDARWASAPIDDYLAKVRDFARATGFDAFYAAHRTYYAAVEDRFRAYLAHEAVLPWFDGFFGPRPHARYVVVPGLVEGPANYAARVTIGEREELYQVVGLENPGDDGLPRPGLGTLELLLHELAHSYVNPIFAAHRAELEPALAKIFPLVATAMAKQAYGDAQVMGYESGVRGITILFLRDRHPERAAGLVDDERYNSFYWESELADVLGRHRGGFEAAIPELAKVFDGFASRYADGFPPLPFRGPINGAQEGAAMVAPTAGELARYVDKIHDKFGSAAPRLAATATWADVGARPAMLYGSPATVPLVASLATASGWTIDAARIDVGGRRFDGEHLVLIACRPRPDDPTRGVVVYASASDDDVVGINAVFHGPNDWVVARRTAKGIEEVAHGDFAKTPAGWKLH